jgi:hypothetical protein
MTKSERNTLRLKIKKTVEDAVPALSIDVTKILTDEETAEIHRQMEQRRAALDLAKQEGRAGLKARFKRSVVKRSYDPMVDGAIEDA